MVFQLVFDGQPLTRNGARQVRLDRLTPGYHRAEFFIPTRFGRSISYRTQVFLDGGLETSFVLVTRNGYPPLLRKVAAFPIPRGGYGPVYEPGRRSDYPAQLPPNSRYDDVPSQGGYDNSSPYPAAPQWNDTYILSPQEVDGLLQAVSRQPFDDGKLALIRESLREASLPAADARQFVDAMSFDKNRIELAKYMYSRVADRQNFYQVYEALQYQSSIREVQQYVDSYHP